MKIGDYEISESSPVLIIAEISCNHTQDINKALQLIKLAKEVGADAVKFQTYKPDTITIDCNNDFFRIKDCPLWEGVNLFELYQKTFTPWEWFPILQKCAHDLGLIFFSSPFDVTSVDMLETLNVPCYKIASLEITDHLLLKRVAQTKKPVIVSTGTATVREIEEAIEVLKANGSQDIILLKCTSSYPTDLSQTHLRTINDMKTRFNLSTGLSDHTKGIIAPITATALGISVIEKHFMLEGETNSEDAEFSLIPSEFAKMVEAVRDVERALGRIQYYTESEKGTRNLRKSLFIGQDMRTGDKFTTENLKSVRPAYGLSNKYYEKILGKTCTRDLKKGDPVTWHIVS